VNQILKNVLSRNVEESLNQEKFLDSGSRRGWLPKFNQFFLVYMIHLW